jgi:NAD-dependent dihydropyrimidine dehydrogenase PreA subunit
MAKRKIIEIDEEKCNGCGACIPNCPEGAMQVIDGKARLVSDISCDGLGACIGHCPEGAISVVAREAEEYSEGKVMENIVKQGKNVLKAHLQHLKEHGENEYLRQAMEFLKARNIPVPEASGHVHQGCPGSRVMDFRNDSNTAAKNEPQVRRESQLRQRPVQIMLVPPQAPYLNNADLLIAADCVGFAYASFHEDLLKGKILLVGCPKLDDTRIYQEKFSQMFKYNNIKSIAYAHMEVPCCFGLIGIIKQAIVESGKEVPFKEITISIKGEKSE